MLKKIANIEESITESGSVGLKKSLESEEYRISSSNDDLPKAKPNQKEISTKQKSPSGLSDSLENPHLKSHELDSKKHSSEYDSAELSRNFNYEESEDTLKAKPKSIPSKKSGDNDTEYDDDFESTSNLYDSSMNKSKKSFDKFDEIEEIRKRNLQYKSNLEAFKGGLKTSDEHEEEISKRLDSYRAKDEIKEESEGSSPQISKKASPIKVKPATLSSDENKLLELIKKDAENNQNSLQLMNQDLTNEKYQKEIEAKKFEMDAKASRMEALNANETIKRMKDQILKYAQEVNVYRVEIEGLKRQIDISDSNAKTKEEEAKRIQEDYERKIKLAEERHAVQSVKQESREVNELKRENRLLKDAHEEEMRVKFEEVDYLTKRCEKLEAENVSLRVGNKAARDAEAKAKKYEEEVHSLRMRLKEQLLSKEAAPVTGSNYNNWTKEQLVRELLCIDRAIERFTKENETLMFENKKQVAEIQELNALLYKESQKIEDFKNKIVKETGSVIVAEDDKELHIKSVKDLGVNHVISKKELDETRDRLFKAEKAKIDIEQLMNMKEVEYKSEIENLRQQKIESERKLIGMDSALKTQIMENDKLKEDYSNSLNKINQEKEEANQKVKWYMENQGIIEKDSEALHQKDARIEQLKEEVKTLQAKDGGRQKMVILEKQVKDLQSALASKNPDSIPLMLSAVKPSFEEQEEYRKLKEQNENINKALQEKDIEFDKRIRTLRIEIDKMKEKYESTKTAGLSEGVKDKRIQDLERQLQETKDYYIDRLKKLEQKTGPVSIIAEKKAQINNDMAYLKEIERLKKENETLKKSSLKIEKPGKDIKINSKEKPLDLPGAIDKLMNEDYIFSLCILLKDVLKIKSMLEKKATYEDCIKDVSLLIDHIEKASLSFKSTAFFSKIADKCVELSKILQGDASSKADNSLPHQKCTAIEKIIRDEINSKIKIRPERPECNADLVVVEIEDKIESQPAPRRKEVKIIEDEDYWSDFSDDVFTCEVNEESKAQEVLLSLQRWIYSSNLESELKTRYSKSPIITLDEFKDSLESAGYYSELLDLQTLLKRLDIKEDRGINYKEFLINITEKNAAWWKESLKNNGFDLNVKGKTGMHRTMCNKAINKFIKNNLREKTQQAISRAGFLNPNEFIDKIFRAPNQKGISKKSLRKVFLANKIPLTRLDTHMLYKALENQEGVITRNSFDTYVNNSKVMFTSKEAETVSSDVYQTVVIDDDKVCGDLPQSLNRSKEDKFDSIQNRLIDHIKQNKIDAEEKLRSLDEKKSGLVDIKTFTKFNDEIKSPLPALDQKMYFNKLIMQLKGKVTISDLCAKLKEKSASKFDISSNPEINLNPSFPPKEIKRPLPSSPERISEIEEKKTPDKKPDVSPEKPKFKKELKKLPTNIEDPVIKKPSINNKTSIDEKLSIKENQLIKDKSAVNEDLNIKDKTSINKIPTIKDKTNVKDISKDNEKQFSNIEPALKSKISLIKNQNKHDDSLIRDDSLMMEDSLIREDSPTPSPSKIIKPSIRSTDNTQDKQVKDLEVSIREKNKTIIEMEKEISSLRSQLKQPSSGTSKDTSDLAKENRDLNRKLKESEEKYSRDKRKYEELIKDSISTPIAGDFVLLQKKIEYLERNIYEREKETQRELLKSTLNSKDKQEISKLKGQIEAERSYYSQIIDKKNNEIRIFRDELDMMLQELEDLKKQNLEKELMFMQNKSKLVS